MVKVKFCGITNLKDALDAVNLGADALGFIFAKSQRRITPNKAKEIIKRLPPYVTTVGVFVNEKINKIQKIVKQCGIDFVQLHGDESPLYCKKLGLKIIKVIKNNIKDIPLYNVSGIILDTYEKGKEGGTGKVFDWKIAKQAKKFGKPIILSGGLNPKNINKAIKQVMPYAVDVSTGIEKRPGAKDYSKMKSFIKMCEG